MGEEWLALGGTAHQKSELLTPAFASDCGHNLAGASNRDAKKKKARTEVLEIPGPKGESVVI